MKILIKRDFRMRFLETILKTIFLYEVWNNKNFINIVGLIYYNIYNIFVSTYRSLIYILILNLIFSVVDYQTSYTTWRYRQTHQNWVVMQERIHRKRKKLVLTRNLCLAPILSPWMNLKR